MSNELNKLYLDEKLAEPTPKEEIKYRQAKYDIAEGKSVQMLAYVDARYVCQRLDEVFGVSNWSNEFLIIGGKTFCKLTCTFPDGTVVSKMDVGAETEFEQEKGVVSDALKRVAVLFGIGRDLYALPKYYAEAGRNGYVDRDWRPRTNKPNYIPKKSNPTRTGGEIINNDSATSSTSPPVPSPHGSDDTSLQDMANSVVDKFVQSERTPDERVINTTTPKPSSGNDNKGKSPVVGSVRIDDLELKVITEKAMGVKQLAHEGAETVFIPRSQIVSTDLKEKGDMGYIQIPEWLKKDKNLVDSDVPF